MLLFVALILANISSFVKEIAWVFGWNDVHYLTVIDVYLS